MWFILDDESYGGSARNSREDRETQQQEVAEMKKVCHKWLWE